MNKNRIFEQSSLITVPNASPAGVAVKGVVNLNTNYKRAKGVVLYEVDNPNNDKYKVQIINTIGEVVQTVYSDHLKSSTSVSPNERYRSIDIDTNSQVTVNIIPVANTTAVILIDAMFKLIDEL